MNELLCKVASINAPKQKVSYVRQKSSLYIRDLVLDMSIGIYDFEHQKKQPVKVNIKATTNLSDESWRSEKIEDVADYEPLVIKIREIANSGHIELIETFADLIAEETLSIPYITEAEITVEKPSIFEDANGAGITLHVVKAST